MTSLGGEQGLMEDSLPRTGTTKRGRGLGETQSEEQSKATPQ